MSKSLLNHEEFEHEHAAHKRTASGVVPTSGVGNTSTMRFIRVNALAAGYIATRGFPIATGLRNTTYSEALRNVRTTQGAPPETQRCNHNGGIGCGSVQCANEVDGPRVADKPR